MVPTARAGEIRARSTSRDREGAVSARLGNELQPGGSEIGRPLSRWSRPKHSLPVVPRCRNRIPYEPRPEGSGSSTIHIALVTPRSTPSRSCLVGIPEHSLPVVPRWDPGALPAGRASFRNRSLPGAPRMCASGTPANVCITRGSRAGLHTGRTMIWYLSGYRAGATPTFGPRPRLPHTVA